MFRITGYDIIMAIASVALIIICFCCGGCSQRIVRYTDPNGFEIHYKNNTLASKEEIGNVIVKTPNNWLIMIGEYSLDNDSFEIEIDPLTKTVRLKTGE